MIIPFILAFLIMTAISMSVHEYMHARIAYAFGDDTAKLSGRLTINPLAHINPLGLVSFLILGYGWATPVPVNPMRFKQGKYRLGMFFVSIAGVLANILMAFIFSAIYLLVIQNEKFYYGLMEDNQLSLFIFYALQIGISMNLSLFFFNLIPIPPLDGFNMINTLASKDNKFLNFVKTYGFEIFLGYILISNIFDLNILGFLVDFVETRFITFWGSVFL